MSFKVTALKDVKCWARVPTQSVEVIGSAVGVRKDTDPQWITLDAGERRERVGFVVGIHPDYLPRESAITVSGVRMVLLPSYSGDLPREFFGLLRIEEVAD